MIFLISNFLILDSITNVYLSLAHFSTIILDNSILDYIIACFDSLTNSFLVNILACFDSIINSFLINILACFNSITNSFVNNIVACFVPLAFILPVVFYSGKRIAEIIRDASLTVGGLGTGYTAYRLN